MPTWSELTCSYHCNCLEFHRRNGFHQVDLFKYRLWHLSHNIWHGKCYRRDIDPKIQRCLLPSCGCTRVCALLHDGKTLQLALLAYVVKCLNCVSSSSSPSVSLKRPIQFQRVWKQLLPGRQPQICWLHTLLCQIRGLWICGKTRGSRFNTLEPGHVNFMWLFLDFWVWISTYLSSH